MRPLSILLWLILLLISEASAYALKQMTVNNVIFTVAEVNPKKDRLILRWINQTTNKPYQTFDQLQKRLAKEGLTMLFATNSGIYKKGPIPLGLHIENKKTLTKINNARRGGNFALLPNGIFWLDGTRAGVTETQAYKTLKIQPTYATQSGPLLVQNGKLHPKFRRSGRSLKTRSGVGVCQDGLIRFVISRQPVNFYSFATLFRDKLGCPNALYLDGSISSYATKHVDNQFVSFAGMWAVVEKKR